MTAGEKTPSGAVRVGIVDDDTVLARALVRTVQSDAGFRVTFTAESLAEGRAKLAEQPVDVLLVDVGLPDGDGLELVAEAQARGPCKVLVVSVFGDGRTVVRAIERGADGYLLKGSAGPEAVAAIRSVLEGGAPISPAVAGHILSRVRGLAPQPREEVPATPTIALTPREITVLEHLAKGFSFKEVARVEGISYHTVADHVKAIYRKLSVNSRGEAVFEAIQAGLIDVRE
ncbi:MAG: response regulator transcription factor [Polyangiales bacterium]